MGVLLRRAKNFGLESRRHAMNMPKVNMVAETTPSHSLLLSSKYPPAEPEALRLLAPQRGLIATAEKQKQLQRHEAREATGFGKTKATAGGILPEFSKFDCLPGRAGGTPISLGSATLLHLLRSDNAAARKRASASGHRQHKLGKNPFQLGGSFVFAHGNRDLYAHVSKTFGDTASVAELLAVIP